MSTEPSMLSNKNYRRPISNYLGDKIPGERTIKFAVIGGLVGLTVGVIAYLYFTRDEKKPAQK